MARSVARFSRLRFLATCFFVVTGCAGGSKPGPDPHVSASTPAPAGSAPAAPAVVPLPDTPPGNLARGLFAAVNSGKDDELRVFLKEHLSEAALKEAPFDEWFTYFQSMGRQSGGVDVVSEALPRGPAR